jgi:MFS family permease
MILELTHEIHSWLCLHSSRPLHCCSQAWACSSFFPILSLTNAGVSSEKIGLINAGFYLGALLSGIIAQRWVAKVGHIRAFALFTAIHHHRHFVACGGASNEIALIVLRVILGLQ